MVAWRNDQCAQYEGMSDETIPATTSLKSTKSISSAAYGPVVTSTRAAVTTVLTGTSGGLTTSTIAPAVTTIISDGDSAVNHGDGIAIGENNGNGDINNGDVNNGEVSTNTNINNNGMMGTFSWGSSSAKRLSPSSDM